MLFGKSNTSDSHTTSFDTHPQGSIVVEVVKVFWIAAAFCLLMALLSYSPSDPSWSTFSTKAEFSNWMGRVGSIVSDVLFQLFGIAAFSIAAVLVLIGFTGNKPNFTTPVLFLLSFSSLIQCVFPAKWTPWNLPNPGGYMGRMIIAAFEYLTGPLGATILSIFFAAVTTIIVFRWKLVSFLSKMAKNTAKTLFAAVVVWGYSIITKMKMLAAKLAVRKKLEVANPAPKLEVPAEAVQQLTSFSQTIMLDKKTRSIAKEEAAAAVTEIPEEEQTDENGIPITMNQNDEDMLKLVNPLLNKRGPIDAKKKLFRKHLKFQMPDVNMLSGKADSKTKQVDKNWYLEKANILVQKLKDFGVEGEVVNISPGPVITVYEFKPASGVKIKEIANLSDDLTLALSVLSVRIVAPIPGKPVVGIEIPSPHRETVYFKDLVQETPFYKPEIRIPLALGRLASGEPVTADLAAMPHLLVAGSTGTGKSVFINTLITSLIYRFAPDQLKMILIDPKMVELSLYEGIPHLLLPVVVDSKKAALSLRWTVDEMERRYTLMHQFGVRHLDAYNEKLASKGGATEETPFLPYIVVVIDEYADLMAVAPKDVELSIARLAQKARASGIHLVCATQRPSTDVVTGTIKANFPSRISFRVASSVDSKTILDRTGADRLLGQGDMLFHSAGFTSLKRMQGAFITDNDIAKIVEFLKAQGEPEYDERIMKSLEASENPEGEENYDGGEGGEGAKLYDQAVRLVTEKGEASISLIQRHLRIGYNRAATLMEQMEKEGVVAPSSGSSKRRAVIASQI